MVVKTIARKKRRKHLTVPVNARGTDCLRTNFGCPILHPQDKLAVKVRIIPLNHKRPFDLLRIGCAECLGTVWIGWETADGWMSCMVDG